MTFLSRMASSVLAMALTCALASAQAPILIHSHNDYERQFPFYQAYAQGVNSIECDLHLIDGKLFVSHDLKDVKEDHTFEKLYVEPIVYLFRHNGGHPYRDPSKGMQLLIDLKTNKEPELSTVIKVLKKYPDVFNPQGVIVTITGNRPEPSEFCNYPEIVCFDGELDKTYTAEQLKRVPLFSACFRNYSKWKGEGPISPAEEVKIREAIDKAHSMGKPIRFWGGPEGTTVYSTFYNLGIDYINTDNPEQCAGFFAGWGDKN